VVISGGPSSSLQPFPFPDLGLLIPLPPFVMPSPSLQPFPFPDLGLLVPLLPFPFPDLVPLPPLVSLVCLLPLTTPASQFMSNPP